MKAEMSNKLKELQDSCKPKRQYKKKIVKPFIRSLSKIEIRRIVEKKFSKLKKTNSQQNKKISLLCLKECLKIQQLTCSICLELMIKPTTLECGHSFCLRCIEKLNTIQMTAKCSLCRANEFFSFYEINHKIEEMILHTFPKLKQEEQQEYIRKQKSLKKEFVQRSLQHKLKIGQKVKIKLKSGWQRGDVQSVLEKGGSKIFYLVRSKNQKQYMLRQDSVNIILNQEYNKAQVPSLTLFSKSTQKCPIANAYNFEEILWEVMYYPPIESHRNVWNFQPEAGHRQNLFDSDNESAQFISRNLIPDIIELD